MSTNPVANHYFHGVCCRFILPISVLKTNMVCKAIVRTSHLHKGILRCNQVMIPHGTYTLAGISLTIIILPSSFIYISLVLYISLSTDSKPKLKESKVLVNYSTCIVTINYPRWIEKLIFLCCKMLFFFCMGSDTWESITEMKTNTWHTLQKWQEESSGN